MNDIDLCMGCMEEKGGAETCPHCGWVEGTPPELPHYLPPGTILNDRYLLGKVLGQGGFGITYLGWDLVLNSKLAVKEYLPQTLATRVQGATTVSAFTAGESQESFNYGLNKFLEEARALAQFIDHPGIVGVRDFFPANGTAYLVMQYIDGSTFKDFLKEQGGKVSIEVAMGVMMPAMDALKEVHSKNIIHRDISPDNIYILNNGQVKLLDFGAARQAIGEQGKSLSIILKAGYAPEEQYRSRGEQGPWTDIYAVGATIYRAITGQVPPEALDRMYSDSLTPPSKLGVNISPPVEEAVLMALAVNARDRFQNIQAMQNALMGVKAAPPPVVAQAANSSWSSGTPAVSTGPVSPGFPVSATPISPSPSGSGVPPAREAGEGLYIGPGSPQAPKKKSAAGKVLIGVGVFVLLAVVGLGALIMSMANTTGTLNNSDGSRYEGQLSWGVPSGQGVMTYANGDRYEGLFKNGKREGQGTLTEADGTKFAATWLADEISGQATITESDGRKYVGEVKNLQADGKGALTLADGGKYDGQWKANHANGYGVMVYSNGDRYEGEWKDDKREGKGVMTTADYKYDGQWRNDEANGYGVVTYSDGSRYQGEFKDNMFNGQGTGILPDGTTMSGWWENNEYLGP